MQRLCWLGKACCLKRAVQGAMVLSCVLCEACSARRAACSVRRAVRGVLYEACCAPCEACCVRGK